MYSCDSNKNGEIVYLAGPLFSVAEREFNGRLAGEIRSLRPQWTVVLPQEQAKAVNKGDGFEQAVYQQCLDNIRKCTVIVAILDGSDVDSGTCVEIGYALALNKRVIGVRTDFRAGNVDEINLMVSCACESLIAISSDGVSSKGLVKDVVEKIEGH